MVYEDSAIWNNSSSARNSTVSALVKVSVIIPTLNEAENLPHVLPCIPNWIHELIIIDGHSTDDTVAVARGLWKDVKIVLEPTKGKGAALRAGVAAATGDIIVMLDADGSTDPLEIPRFVATLLSGADYAKGSRFIQGGGTIDMPLYRQMGNEALVILANILFRTRFTDITYGYNAFWRTYADKLALELDGWSSEIITNIRVARYHLRVVEVASFEYCRVAGEAKLQSFSAGWAILKAIVRERFRPLKSTEGSQPTSEIGAWKNSNDFTQSVKVLVTEAMHLAREAETMAPETYQDNVNAVKAAYERLLDMQSHDRLVQQIQSRYARYDRIMLWSVLEQQSKSAHE